MDDEGLVNYFDPRNLKIGVEKDDGERRASLMISWKERRKEKKKSKAVVDGMDDGKA